MENKIQGLDTGYQVITSPVKLCYQGWYGPQYQALPIKLILGPSIVKLGAATKSIVKLCVMYV